MRTLVLHPAFDAFAGAELVGAHILRRLLERGASVRVLTLHEPRMADVPSGMAPALADALADGRLVFETLGPPRAFGSTLARAAWLHREARARVGAYDLWVSTYNEANLGRPGLQYVHHPLFASRRLLRQYAISTGRSSPARAAYDTAVRAIAGASPHSFRTNETLTNSAFMAGVIKEAYGICSTVLYPAFLRADGRRDDRPREPHVVALGRIAPDKHTLDLLDLFGAMHAQAPGLRFTIAGYEADIAYAALVRQHVQSSALPIDLVMNASETEIRRLLATSRYFVQPKPYEHFGIATVEAMSAGALPLVHATGGSVEIVPDRVLWFLSPTELGTKVRALEASPTLRESTQQALHASLHRFRVEAFDRGLDASVERALART